MEQTINQQAARSLLTPARPRSLSPSASTETPFSSRTKPSSFNFRIWLTPQLLTRKAPATITNDEASQSGSFNFNAASYSVNENGVNATVTVKRSGGSDGAVAVQYATSDGTATANSDYTNASGTLSWADGGQRRQDFHYYHCERRDGRVGRNRQCHVEQSHRRSFAGQSIQRSSHYHRRRRAAGDLDL